MSPDTASILPLLNDIELFANFDKNLREELANNMREVYLKKDDILFSKGDQESAMYIILEGSVQIHDEEYIFTTLNNKQFFGEYSLIDSAVRSATVTAMRETKLLELNQESFNEVTEKRPEIWKTLLLPLVKRLRDYNILEEKLTLRTLDVQKKKYQVEKEKENIEWQKKELEAINTTKDKFFTILANDLKNPFSTLISLSGSLINEYDKYNSEEALTKISQINRHSRNAFNLLENLLQWAKSQTGSLKINFKRTNVASVVNELMELFSVNCTQKGIALSSSIGKDLYAYVDVNMLTTVFRNLISNAIQQMNYGGEIKIGVEKSGDMLTIEVFNNNTNLSTEEIDNMFNLDKPQKDDNKTDSEGSNLGLILCKEFVLKNGGEIWVENKDDNGISVKFTIPKAL